MRVVCGRFITNRSARASKGHHCIFGLQTSSHSPGPRCSACADTPKSYSRQAPVLGLGHLLDGPSSPPQGGELGRLFPAAVLVESLFVRREFGEIRQRTVLEVLRCLPTGGAGLAAFLLLPLRLLRRGLRSRLGGRRYGRRLCGAPRPVEPRVLAMCGFRVCSTFSPRHERGLKRESRFFLLLKINL